MSRFFIIVSLTLLIVFGALVPVVQAETSAVPFLAFNPSARSAGMAQSVVADFWRDNTSSTSDAYATWWNPAALSYMTEDRQLAFTRIDWLPELDFGLAYYYFTYSQQFEDWGNFGLSLSYFDMGEYLRTDENAQELGYDKAYDGAVTFSYGTQLMPSLALGLNIKFIYSHLADEGTGQTEQDKSGTGMTWATDIGLLYNVPVVTGLKLGMNLQNFGPDITYINDDQADPIPRTLRLGLAYTKRVGAVRFTGTAEYDKVMIRTNDGISEELKESTQGFGAEVWYATPMNETTGFGFGGGLRVGYTRERESPGAANSPDSYIDGPSFGGGVALEFANYTVEIDYGMFPGGDLSDYNRFYSLAIDF
ncbi:MAG: hypothetical protein D6675_02085 [Gemmatimonadetes bacterium]|nr:MAG: hypothetical protein D6675_02085 [Gemmatimonadota bacterium]